MKILKGGYKNVLIKNSCKRIESLQELDFVFSDSNSNIKNSINP